MWPGLAWQQTLLLVLVWVHGCIGMHYWLSLAGMVLARAARAARARRGAADRLARRLHRGGTADGGAYRAAGRLGAAADGLARARWPDRGAPHHRCATGCRWHSCAAARAGVGCARRYVRSARAAGAKVEVTYRGGPMVRVPLGPTLLEISRMSDVPHASACGGRARCSTCRVGVESGLADLHAALQRRSHDACQHSRAAARAACLPDPAARAHHGHPPRRATFERPRRQAAGRPARKASSATWWCCSWTRAASP